MNGKVPHSPEAEQALVASLLLEPRHILSVAASLDPEDIYTDSYRAMFNAMVNLSRDGRSVDIVAIQQATGDAPVDVLELTAGHRAAPEEYVEIIKRKALGRRVLSAMRRVSGAAVEDDEDVIQVLQREVTDLVRGSEDTHLVSARAAAEEYRQILKVRQEGREEKMTWGLPGLDGYLHNPTPGRMVIFASRPGVGKTAAAETIADHWSGLGMGPVVFASMEMGRDELIERACARESGIAARSIIRGEMSPSEFGRVAGALDKIALRNIEYIDDARCTTDALRSHLARVKLQHDNRLAGVVVDYVQLLADAGDGNEVQRVSRMSRALKALAREYNVPVLVLSQLNRTIEMRDEETPMLSDLRDSGALEQDADAVVIITGRRGSGMRTFHLLKQRQGETGKFRVRFDGDTVTWFEPGPWGQGYTEPVPEVKAGEIAW